MPGETAVSAARTPTREGARYRRIARRRGKANAPAAPGNTQLKACHKLLSHPGLRYHDPGPGHYHRRASIHRQLHHHVTKIEDLGSEVTICRRPEPEPGAAADTQAT